MIQGRTWLFKRKPTIIASAAVGGPMEAKGPLADDFDLLHGDLWFGQDSFEKAEKKLLEEATERAIHKANLRKEDIQFFLSGDLMNQVITSSFTARTLGIPYLGIFGACSTSMQGLALASVLVDAGFAKYVLSATSSHNAAAEKQYRYPTEYGSQKPPTAQWTVTGAGAAVVAPTGEGPRVTAATIGRIVDLGVSDPFNMGAAMAPAAVDTIQTHFHDLQLSSSAYDLVLTGDLGQVGYTLAHDLLEEQNFRFPKGCYADCGLMIYHPDQPVFSGGSGAGCSATVVFGHIMNRMRRGELKKVLVVATGALLSPISYQQKESIPCIAHAVALEAGGDEKQ